MKSVKKMNKIGETILWALDPTQNPADSKKLVIEMKHWAKKLNCAIQPISIFSNGFLRFPLDLNHTSEDRILKTLEKSISTFARKAGLTKMQEPEIVFIKESSRRKKAQVLADKAEAQNAVMIFANTHATQNPFRLGGFAETLLACSQVPVLLMNAKALPSRKMDSILFPTDFSRDSRNALTHMVPFAKAFNAKVHLFNQLEGPTYYASEFTGYAPPDALRWEELLKDVEAGRKRHAQAWLQGLKQKEISCDATLIHQKKSTTSDILDFAKKSNSSVIAMATRSGAVARFFLGSIAREILLAATCPVIICYRPKAAEALNDRKSTKRYPVEVHQDLR